MDWVEAQQHMLNNWGHINPQAFDTSTTAWHHMMLQSIRLLTSQADPTAREVSERLFASQMGMLRLLERATHIWQVIMPTLQAGETWAAPFAQHIQQLRVTMLRTATEGLHLYSNPDQSWQAFLRDGQVVLQPWLTTIQNIQSRLSEDPSGLLNLSSLSGDMYRNALPSQNLDTKLRHSFAAWTEMQQAAYDYNSLLTEVWIGAFERLIRELAQLAEQGERVENVRDFLNRWSATADDVYKQASRSDEYIRGQTHLINTMMIYRQRQRQVNEAVMEWIDIPTRSEIDETHRRVYELNKEVKALRRELAEVKSTLQQLTTPKVDGE